jgi:DNA adenine methylase
MTSRSPLRYPGGKQKLSPFLVELLVENDLIGGHYAEPYAGGAGAAIELLLSGHVHSIHLNDSSRAIYAFWNSILNKTDEFCQRIQSASLTVDEWRRQQNILKDSDNADEFDLGFSTFYLNRCNRSGVLTGGLIGGINQNGNYKMDARFTRNDLIRRVEAVAMKSTQITLSNLDAEQYLLDYREVNPHNTLIYFDPPYYEKASGLYLDFYRKDDHARLANVVQSLDEVNWILSYDNALPIVNLYDQRRLFTYDLQYNAATVYKGKEVFVFCDSLKIPKTSKLSYIDIALKELYLNRLGLADILVAI